MPGAMILRKQSLGHLIFYWLIRITSRFVFWKPKKEKLHPLVAKEQARKYALTVGARFIILSNGIVHYLWDLKKGNPKPIYKFPSPQEIGAIKEWNPDRNALAFEPIEEDFIAIVQMPDYAERPEWKGSVDESKDFVWRERTSFLKKISIKRC